jgi:hypothetical protein
MSTPAKQTKRPIKARRLKKADWEGDFFFMVEDKWIEG